MTQTAQTETERDRKLDEAIRWSCAAVLAHVMAQIERAKGAVEGEQG